MTLFKLLRLHSVEKDGVICRVNRHGFVWRSLYSFWVLAHQPGEDATWGKSASRKFGNSIKTELATSRAQTQGLTAPPTCSVTWL